MNKQSFLLAGSLLLLIVGFSSFMLTDKTNQDSSFKNDIKIILKNGMDAFTEPYGDWKVENGKLILPVKNSRDERTDIWLKNNYKDFVIEFDFKLDVGTNSGIFLRTANTANPVQTGIEVQIRDDHGKSPIDQHFCGSIYEIKEASENRVKKAGKWNKMKIECKGPSIKVYLNKGKVVDINLDDWTEVGKNPDGSVNKFKTAYKDMAREGRIGFQDHGGIVSYRKIRIKEL